LIPGAVYCPTFLKLAEDREDQQRNGAACHAALAAAAGEGADAAKLDDMERSRLRKQARGWLRADLDAWAKVLEAGKDRNPDRVQKTLHHWQTDADLANVRRKAALAKLPEPEREAWAKLWVDVDGLINKAARARPQPKQGNP
jgi:hypothetical protein